MGWASGSEVASSFIRKVKKLPIAAELRAEVYKVFIEALEDADWDTQDEALGMDPAFDLAMRKLHPDWDIEEST